MRGSREKMFEMLEEGALNWENIAVAALLFMSDAEVAAMADLNEIKLFKEDE